MGIWRWRKSLRKSPGSGHERPGTDARHGYRQPDTGGLNKGRQVGSDEKEENGVADGNRTRDHRSHNPVLYQLSYSHH